MLHTLCDCLYGDGRCMKSVGFNPSVTSNRISRRAALLRPHIHCRHYFLRAAEAVIVVTPHKIEIMEDLRSSQADA